MWKLFTLYEMTGNRWKLMKPQWLLSKKKKKKKVLTFILKTMKSGENTILPHQIRHVEYVFLRTAGESWSSFTLQQLSAPKRILGHKPTCPKSDHAICRGQRHPKASLPPFPILRPCNKLKARPGDSLSGLQKTSTFPDKTSCCFLSF